jgi:hypothetical protein
LPTGEGADRTEIDLPDIRAIITQIWALSVYMPLHVINFAKEMMNARPDRTSIHCLLFSGNDWYLAVVDRAGACVEHGGTLRIGQDIEGVEKFLTALSLESCAIPYRKEIQNTDIRSYSAPVILTRFLPVFS